MSTILRGYTTVEYYPMLQSSELKLEIKVPKRDRSDFSIEVADRDFQNFNGQVTDTINFLDKNLLQLKALKSKLPDINWEIDYGFKPKVTTSELAVEGLHFPVELLKLCSELQIEIVLSLYDGKLFE